MRPVNNPPECCEPERFELDEPIAYEFSWDRREFLGLAGGLLILAFAPAAEAQRGRGGSGGTSILGARLHLGEDGTITILTGKIEEGQGPRTEIALAAAEEVRVP